MVELGRLGWRVVVVWECETREFGALTDALRLHFGIERPTHLHGPEPMAEQSSGDATEQT
jgi:G:T-mismatch repair DNA endonuclease (very short patch repair protein)